MDIIYNFDFAILDALQRIHCTVLNVILAFFTYIGEGGAVWIAAALLMLCFAKTRKISLPVILALVMELIINENIIKQLVRRTRPFVMNPDIDTIVHKPSSYSFPSGHTCTAFAAATAIFMHNKKMGIAAYAVAVLIAFSRNYFYIHFPTDVICGAILGAAIGFCSVKITKFADSKIRRNKNQTLES